MELSKVAKNQRKNIVDNVLSQFVSGDEKLEITQNIDMYFAEGSDLYNFTTASDNIGFFISSTYSEDGKNLDELILDEFYFVENKLDNEIIKSLVSNIKKLHKNLSPEKFEIVVTRETWWLGEKLAEGGFIAEMLKLEKILPKPKYLGDVLELIDDSISKDYVADEMILQVLIKKEDEYDTLIIQDIEDLDDHLNNGWVPIMVVVSFEPKNQQISEVVNQSNQLINWDDYEIIYSL